MSATVGGSTVDASFVGRAREQERLAALVERTVAGDGGAVLVMGEAGIGKTRLLRRAAMKANAAGLTVTWGQCWADEGAPALWPWIQVLRSACAAVAALEREPVDVGPGAAVLAEAIPDVAPHIGSPGASAITTAHADFHLREAIARLITDLAAETPIVIFLDDLHWADAASLKLASHMADAIVAAPSSRVAIAASSRVGDVPTMVGQLSSSVSTLLLDGLSAEECGQMAREQLAERLTPTEQDRLRDQTGGVPLLVDAALRRRAGGPGSPVTTPTGTRAASALDAECCAVLEAASVVGRSFELATLAQLVDEEPDEVRARLAAAVRAGVIIDDSAESLRGPDEPAEATAGRSGPLGSVAAQFSFRHALIADEFYDRIPLPRRNALHLGCADLVGGHWDSDRTVSDRARHLLAALPLGDPMVACGAAAEAARGAANRHAHDDAADWYGRALDVHPIDAAERCQLLIARGIALIHGSGVGEAASVFEEAAELADALGDSRAKLEALIWLTEARYRAPGLDLDHRTRLLLAAAADHVDNDPFLLCAASEQLARLETFLGETEVAIRCAERARGAAATSQNPAAATVAARAMRWAAVGPTDMAAKRSASAAFLLSEDLPDPEARWDVHQWMMLDAMEAGDRTAMDAELAACRRVAGDLREPFVTSLTHVWSAGVALMQGRFDDADTDIEAALELMAPSGIDPAGVYSQMAILARDRGQLEGLDELLVEVATAVPESSMTYRAALALIYAEQGRIERARTELDRLGSDGFRRIPRNGVWLTALALCAEACSVLDDEATAVGLLALLAPFRDRSVVAGGGPYLYLGAVSHHIGSLSTSAGAPDRALVALEDAAAVHERLGARAWTARTMFERGRALLRSGGSGIADGRRCLQDAASLAASLGMSTLVQRAHDMNRDDLETEPVLARRGEIWLVEFSGPSFQLPDSKGLRCLHVLIGNPGTSFPADHLVEQVLGDPSVGADRSRVNVTRQVRSAIDKIDDHDHALAQHLRAAVHTGGRCRYQPVVAAPAWRLH